MQTVRTFASGLLLVIGLAACTQSAGKVPATALSQPTNTTTDAAPTEHPAEEPASTETPTEQPAEEADGPAGWTEVTELTTYPDEFGSLIVLGMLKNTSDRQLEYVQIALVLLNADGEEIYRDGAQVTRLAPGGVMPFRKVIDEEPAGWEEIEAEVWDADEVDYLYTELEASAEGIVDPQTSYIYEVEGDVQNVGDQPVETFNISVTYLNDAGELVAVSEGGFVFEWVEPGQSLAFDQGTNTSGGEIVDYEVYTVGVVAQHE